MTATATTTSRPVEAAIGWVEGPHRGAGHVERWRPQWFLDVEHPNGSLRSDVLRGYRNPGYTRGAKDEAGSRAMLATEAKVLAALEHLPVATPGYVGHEPDLGWLLMEFVPGDTALTAIDDEDRRFAIFQGYVEELARLHALPLSQIDAPAELPRPSSCQDFLDRLRERNVAAYRAMDLPRPEPVLGLGLQWLAATPLPGERPLAPGLTDVGPDQFIFDGSRFPCLIDFEFATVSDPLYDIGKMRSRDITYRTGRMPEHLRHYGRTYEELTGIPLDVKALQFWTIAGPTLSNVYTVPGTQRPDPAMVDLTFVYAWEVQQRRAILEGLAEFHDFELEPPTLPAATETMLDPLPRALAEQFDAHYGPRAGSSEDAAFARYTKAIAEAVGRGNAHAPMLAESLDELSSVLGHRASDWRSGMAELEARIRQHGLQDLETTVRFLHRAELRREFLYEPMQQATGVCADRHPLDRI